MSDSEDIISSRPDDLGSMVAHIANFVPWKVSIFVFLAFIVLNTSVFIDKVLTHWPGAVDGRSPTEKGLLIQGFLLTLGMVVMSVLVGGGLV